LIDKNADNSFVPYIINALREAGCEVRGTEDIIAQVDAVIPATIEDWSTEYLDKIIAAKTVDGISGAIAHINQYSSNHTEAVICEDANVAERFFNEIDSAILLHNASTQFADGGEFGMGAEIGIATGKMHARGPVGVEQLTSFKYRVHGNGQTRPS
jgi:glutamate-5-semialdehyde dehydrogenase